MNRHSHLRRWGVVYLLVVIFLASWLGQFAVQVALAADEAQQHGGHFSWEQFTPAFWSATLENWQSEFLQLAVQAGVVVGAADQLFVKSIEVYQRIERKVDALQAAIDQLRSQEGRHVD